MTPFEIAILMASVVNLIIVGVLAWLTYCYTQHTQKMVDEMRAQTQLAIEQMQAQNRPQMVIRLAFPPYDHRLRHRDSPKEVHLCFENIGNQHAYNILSVPNPDFLAAYLYKLSEFSDMNMPCLPAGDYRIFFIGVSHELCDNPEIPGAKFSIVCTYEDLSRKNYTDQFKFDLEGKRPYPGD
ncbi:hypothetical protein IH992_03730 [Candidatus Poribacteria bacterium]|nr:hypothetical protein [Candidatus Poribacteria bacterium]